MNSLAFVCPYAGLLQHSASSTARHSVRSDSSHSFPGLVPCTIIHSLLTVKDGILSIHRPTTGLPFGYPVILPVSAKVREVLNQLFILDIVRNFQFDAVVTLKAWKTMAAFNWDNMTKLDCVLYLYFDKDLVDSFFSDRNIPYMDSSCPIWTEVEKQYLDFTERRGRIWVLRSWLLLWRVLFHGIIFPLRLELLSLVLWHCLVWARLYSPSVSLPLNLLKSTRFQLLPPLRLLFFLAYRNRRMCALRLFHHCHFMATLFPRNCKSPMNFIREQRDATTALLSSRHDVSKSVFNYLAVPSATVNGCSSNVFPPLLEISKLRGWLDRWTSELGSSQVLRDGLVMSRQRLGYRDIDIHRLCKVLISVCGLWDRGLDGSDDQSWVSVWNKLLFLCSCLVFYFLVFFE